MSKQEEIDRLLQKEWRENVIPNIGAEPWIRVYQSSSFDAQEDIGIYCGLVPNEHVGTVLESPSWGFHVGDSAPGFASLHDEATDGMVYKYDRFGFDENGIEPLVIVRNFHGLKPSEIEISEEFRLFHNLYYDSSESTYVRFDDSGDEVPVVRTSDNFVDVRRKEIRQFLAVRDMSLCVYFDNRYFSSLKVEALHDDDREADVRVDNYIYSFFACEWDDSASDNRQSFSRLLGKTIVKGLPREKSGIWPYDEAEEREYVDFIIGLDEDDEPRMYTSPNPDKLANAFGKNKHAPNFLTPVFFRREVLAKYRNEPTKFTVEDGTLRCGGKWLLRIDNNHPDYVIVFLGDLGGELPHKEQIYWKRYNVPPDGHISNTNFRRSILAEFAEPEDSALYFQQFYEMYSKAWLERLGWHLFKPLAEADAHHFNRLRRPLTDEITEFHDIVLSLSILFQDRINKKELGQLIPGFNKKDANNKAKQNIPVLGEFLESEGFGDTAHYVEYLRMLQMLRSNSGTVHPRNEKEYQKAVRFFSLDSKSTVQVADDIFTTLTDFLDSLREHFCPDEAD